MKNSSVSFCFKNCVNFISSYCKKWYNFVTSKCIKNYLSDKPIVLLGHIAMWILTAALCICLVPCVITVAIVAALIELIDAIDHALPPKDEHEALFTFKPRCEECNNLRSCECKDCPHIRDCRDRCPAPGCTDEFDRPICGDEEDNKRLVDKKPDCAFCENLPYCKCNTCRHLEDCKFDCPTEDCQEKCIEILMEEEEFLSDCADEASEKSDNTDPYGDDGTPCD